jgi:hypothetical protein
VPPTLDHPTYIENSVHRPPHFEGYLYPLTIVCATLRNLQTHLGRHISYLDCCMVEIVTIVELVRRRVMYWGNTAQTRNLIVDTNVCSQLACASLLYSTANLCDPHRAGVVPPWYRFFSPGGIGRIQTNTWADIAFHLSESPYGASPGRASVVWFNILFQC